MEFFARDPQVIRQWARHYITNERIPDGLLESALDNKADFAAIELQHQVLLSGADQVFYIVYLFLCDSYLSLSLSLSLFLLISLYFVLK